MAPSSQTGKMLLAGYTSGTFTVIVSTKKYAYVDDTFTLGLQAYYKGFLELSKGPQVTLTSNFKCAATGSIEEILTNKMMVTLDRMEFKLPSASTATSVFTFGNKVGGEFSSSYLSSHLLEFTMNDI